MAQYNDFEVRAYTWQEMHELCKALAAQMQAIQLVNPVIVGIARGGFFPALVLAHELGCRDLFTMSVRTTATEDIRSKRSDPKIYGLNDLPVVDKNVLLVDDVTNTGTTLQLARERLQDLGPKEIITICPVWDTVNELSDKPLTKCAADYFIDTVHAWARFPWEIAT